MLRRLRATPSDGFTLIELLVVIVVVGILVAIAVPLLIAQRKRAVDASMQSDLRRIANEVETYYSDHQSYPAPADLVQDPYPSTTLALDGARLEVSDDATRVALVPAGAAPGTYCLEARNPAANTVTWYFDSDRGGIQPRGRGCS